MGYLVPGDGHARHPIGPSATRPKALTAGAGALRPAKLAVAINNWSEQARTGLLAGLPKQAGHQGEQRPVLPSAAGGGVSPHLDVRIRQVKDPDTRSNRMTERKQSHAHVRGNHVLYQLEAVGLVGDGWRELDHGGDRADDVLVGGIARVTDPVAGAEPSEDLGRGAFGSASACGHAQAPPRGPQPGALGSGFDGGRG